MKTLHLSIIAITILFSAIALPVLPTASAHGICTGLPPRYARLGSYVLSNESIQTGENVTITGELVSMTNKTVQVRLLLYSEPSPHGRWVTLSTNPSGNFALSGNSVISYSITAKALLPGKYYLDPGIDLVGIGASLMNDGCPASYNIQVYGNPLCATNLVAVMKSEDGSPACVKPDTAQKLIERGWAANMADNADNGTIKQTVDHKFPHPPGGFGCGMWSNATGWVKGNCVSPNIPHP